MDELDQIDALQYKPVASTSKLPPPALVQKTLFGGTATIATAAATKARTASANDSALRSLNPKEKAPVLKVVKTWDRSVWARAGWGSSKSSKAKKGKGKKRMAPDSDEDPFDEDEEDGNGDVDFGSVEMELDPDLDPNAKAPPMQLKLDGEAAKTWIYPLNKPKRIYQYNMARRALFDNVLCSLPTGLGKTFIAAVVMLNYYRWFPKGKVIFMAPTRPLVTQQIEACHQSCGIPAEDAAEMTGHDAPALRKEAWKRKRVFYGTPQTVANDLRSGSLNAADVVLLVIDEAHKASGDYGPPLFSLYSV